MKEWQHASCRLFCGVAESSEGFRQAEFDICFAVDKWVPAVDTYHANKPHCNVICDDVILLIVSFGTDMIGRLVNKN